MARLRSDVEFYKARVAEYEKYSYGLKESTRQSEAWKIKVIELEKYNSELRGIIQTLESNKQDLINQINSLRQQ